MFRRDIEINLLKGWGALDSTRHTVCLKIEYTPRNF